jgi:hypothetical protein
MQMVVPGPLQQVPALVVLVLAAQMHMPKMTAPAVATAMSMVTISHRHGPSLAVPTLVWASTMVVNRKTSISRDHTQMNMKCGLHLQLQDKNFQAIANTLESSEPYNANRPNDGHRDEHDERLGFLGYT